MKKTFLLALALIMVAGCAFLVTSCGDEPVELAAPVVTLEGDVAKWQADANATKLEISIDGSLSYLESTVTSKKLEDGQSFKVRAIGDGELYTDSAWSNTVTYTAPVQGGEETTYTVTWISGDIILETDTGVKAGSTPTYDGEMPTKAADAEFTYTFKGWSPEISPVTGNVTYEAQFEKILIEQGGDEEKNYTVTWKNGDVVLETDTNVQAGTTPTYDGETPTKAADAQFTYIFKGWSPEVSPVTGDITYKAQFEGVLNTYVVDFYSEDGSVKLYTAIVTYGDTAIYAGVNPSKSPTEGANFIFGGWVTTSGGSELDDLTNVTADRQVYAYFKEITKKVSVFVASNNVDYGTVSVSVFNNIDYGTRIVINGNQLIVGENVSLAVPTEKTAQYTYEFIDWITEETVGNSTVIIANFACSVNEYTVTWKNGSDVLELDTNVPYGTVPKYGGAVPVREESNGVEYSFSGWTPVVSAVTGDVVYEAMFTEASTSVSVTFYDDDGTTILGVSAVRKGETASYPYGIPAKEATPQYQYTFDKWVTEKGGSIEANLASVTKNISVYASYERTARKYTVTFKTWDGTTIHTQEVEYGQSAQSPAAPIREGYRFSGWDKNVDRITENTNVTAVYVREFEVRFVDYDNTAVDLQFVAMGSAAIKPDDPQRDGYRFVGWDAEFTNVQDDITVSAIYAQEFIVEFLDYDGTVLKTERVIIGEKVTAPKDPSLEGYTFNGWDKPFNSVDSNIAVNATYVVNKYTVTFVMPDGTVLSEYEVEYGFSAQAPSVPKVILENKNGAMSIYGFIGWNRSFDKITSETTVAAVYDGEYEGAVIIVDASASTNKATVYIAKNKDKLLYAIEIKAAYKTEAGNITIDSIETNTAGIFSVDDNESETLDYVKNNNEKSLSIIWSNINGEIFDYIDRVLTISFGTSGNANIEHSFVIVECNAVLGDEGAENLEQVEAVVIYR